MISRAYAGGHARHGHTLLELLLAMGLMTLLGGLGAAALPRCSPALGALHGELRASVEQAFLLARARGGDVRMVLDATPGEAGGLPAERVLQPLVLPPGVRWGLPASVTHLPAGMKGTVQAHRTGSAHPGSTVTPRGTALGNAWFLTDGRDAVCLRLDDFGGIQALRWRHRLGQWLPL